MADVVSDFIRIVCTDKGTHPSREIAVIWWHRSPDDLIAALIADPHDPKVVREFIEWEQMDALSRRSATRGGSVYLADLYEREFLDRRGPLWRFVCPTCRRDVPLRNDKVCRLIEGLLAAGRVSVDLSYIGASLS